jgi:signal transduction histidine kinase
MFRSFRLRLAFWSAVVAGLALAGFSGTAWWSIREAKLDRVDANIRAIVLGNAEKPHTREEWAGAELDLASVFGSESKVRLWIQSTDAQTIYQSQAWPKDLTDELFNRPVKAAANTRNALESTLDLALDFGVAPARAAAGVPPANRPQAQGQAGQNRQGPPGPNPPPQPGPNPNPQPAPNLQNQPGPNPQPQPGPNPQPQPGPNPQPQPGPNPQAQAGPNPQPQPGPNPQAQAGPNPQPQPGPNPQSQAAQNSQSQPGPNPQFQPAPNPQSQAAPNPQAQAAGQTGAPSQLQPLPQAKPIAERQQSSQAAPNQPNPPASAGSTAASNPGQTSSAPAGQTNPGQAGPAGPPPPGQIDARPAYLPNVQPGDQGRAGSDYTPTSLVPDPGRSDAGSGAPGAAPVAPQALGGQQGADRHSTLLKPVGEVISGAANLPLLPSFKVANLGGHWRVGSVITQHGRIAVAVDLEGIQREMAPIRRSFFWAIPLALLIISAGSWWLSERMLTSLKRITRSIEAINASGLERRVSRQGVDHEFENLIDGFNRLLERLSRSFSQASRFSADAAHELKTPLAILQGEIERAIQAEDESSPRQRTLSGLLDQVQRLGTISRKLLLLSHADAGNMTIRKESFDLTAEIENLLEDLSMVAPQLTLRHEVSPALKIAADLVLVRQVMQNLLSNAVKYNIEDGWLALSADRFGPNIRISIANSTVANLVIDRRQIFQRFYRADGTRNSVEGTGLGLSLSREIVRAHGGDLRLEDGPAGQVRFTVTLPAQ